MTNPLSVGSVVWEVLVPSAGAVPRWEDLWNKTGSEEPWWHPAIACALSPTDSQCICFALSSETGGILLPVALRSIATLPFAKEWSGWCDFVTPYGYGGPLVWGEGAALSESFWAKVTEWCKANQVVAGFLRLAVFIDELAHPIPGMTDNRLNVVWDVSSPVEARWKAVAHKVRKNVNRAIGEGVVVRVGQDAAAIADFLHVYSATMERRGAAEEFSTFVTRVWNALRPHPSLWMLFNAYYQDHVISTELVLLSRQRGYSFLGGTLSDHFALRPNDLIKWEVARWLHESGRVAYVLGGGVAHEDGIFQYKRSFAPTGCVPFSVGKYSILPDVIDELERARERWLVSRGLAHEGSADFYPPYRKL